MRDGKCHLRKQCRRRSHEGAARGQKSGREHLWAPEKLMDSVHLASLGLHSTSQTPGNSTMKRPCQSSGSTGPRGTWSDAQERKPLVEAKKALRGRWRLRRNANACLFPEAAIQTTARTTEMCGLTIPGAGRPGPRCRRAPGEDVPGLSPTGSPWPCGTVTAILK